MNGSPGSLNPRNWCLKKTEWARNVVVERPFFVFTVLPSNHLRWRIHHLSLAPNISHTYAVNNNFLHRAENAGGPFRPEKTKSGRAGATFHYHF